RDAAADLDFEKAARLRDEIKHLRETELAIADDPLAREIEAEFSGSNRGAGSGKQNRKSLFQKPSLDNMGPGTDMAKPLFRKNTLDEMTVKRTEVPAGDSNPAIRRERPGLGSPGLGSYEVPSSARKARRPGKTGRPGR